MIYLSGCTKGGVGKTTFATNFAAASALAGHRVCLADSHKQQHSNGWCNERARSFPRAAKVIPRVLSGSIAKDLAELAREFDDVIVDAGGTDSRELRSALRVADVVVMPFAVSQFDMNEVEVMQELVEVAREYNPKLDALAVINKAETNWVRSSAAAEARAFIAGFDGLRLAETVVYLWPSPFDRASKQGLSVHELGRSGEKASDALARLMDEAGGSVAVSEETEECRRVGARGAEHGGELGCADRERARALHDPRV